MAPRRVRADEHDKVGLVEIGIDPRHRVGAEGAAMARDRRGHAQARVGIHVGGADEAFHQLVGDIVILREELPGEIERDRIGPVLLDDPLEAGRDRIERRRPAHLLQRTIASYHRMQQPAVQSQRLAQRRTLRAQCAEIGWMHGIAGDVDAAAFGGPRDDAAADAAIRARRTHALLCGHQYTSC
jgi:hypothetical protein